MYGEVLTAHMTYGHIIKSTLWHPSAHIYSSHTHEYTVLQLAGPDGSVFVLMKWSHIKRDLLTGVREVSFREGRSVK